MICSFTWEHWEKLSVRQESDLLFLHSMRDALAEYLIAEIEGHFEAGEAREMIDRLCQGSSHDAYNRIDTCLRRYCSFYEPETHDQKQLKLLVTISKRIAKLEYELCAAGRRAA